MTWRERIIIDPAVLADKPVIKGTRLAVEFIVDLLAKDWPESEILRNYPGLIHEDIQACLSYTSYVAVEHGQYVVNEKGEKVAIILPIEEYEKMKEDLHDLVIVAERRNEKTIIVKS